jgi:hypothetical protein
VQTDSGKAILRIGANEIDQAGLCHKPHSKHEKKTSAQALSPREGLVPWHRHRTDGETSEPVKIPEGSSTTSEALLYSPLLASLPEKKIEEFANSEFFNLYRQVFEKLGLS